MTPTLLYRIDREDRLVFLSEGWDDFALENGAPELTADSILGRSIDEFISGWETKHLYHIIYHRVRRTGRELSFPFRCDSPQEKRFLEMRITPTTKGGLQFTTRVLRVESRPPPLFRDRPLERSAHFVVICSWCKRIQIENDAWIEMEESTERFNYFGERPPTLTHEICSDCLAMFRRQMADGPTPV